jgi:sugar/nucleoside kinase (ribokinase family)
MFALPAYPVTELRDPTGAGDSFAGALLGYLAATGSTDFATLKQAMVYGTAVASLTVEAFSTDRLAKAGCREIRARRKELLKLIKA